MKKKSKGLMIVILSGMWEIVCIVNFVFGIIRGNDLLDLIIRAATAVFVVVIFIMSLYRYRTNNWKD